MPHPKIAVLVSVSVLFFGLYALDVSHTIPVVSYGQLALNQPAQSYGESPHAQVAPPMHSHDKRDSLIFVGDVMLARNTEYLMGRHGLTYPFQGIVFESLSAHPFVVGNFEAAVPTVHISTPPYQLRFSVNQSHLRGLSAAGFDLVSLANNHAYDFGRSGYIHTQTSLLEHGVSVFGHPKYTGSVSHHITTIDDVSIGLIALHELGGVTSHAAFIDVMSDIARHTDFQIVYVHWGAEYEPVSNTEQQRQARMFIAAGADLIIGHHPHVVQEIGLIDGVPVLYSLGNYIFDQYFSSEVQRGLLAQITFADATPMLHLHPVSSTNTPSQPHFPTPQEHVVHLVALANKSHPKLREYILSGAVPLEHMVATSAKIAMIKE